MEKQLSNDMPKEMESDKLEKVSGGYVYHASPEIAGVKTKRWEVVDDGNGKVVGRYATKDEAMKMATAKGQSVKEIYDCGEDGLWNLRNSDSH